MGVGGIPGPVRQYVSGLGVAILGLGAAGWLALAPVASGYRAGGAQPQAALHRAALADWGTAAALGAVSLATLLAWIVAWRRKLRADGILAPPARRGKPPPASGRRGAWREARAQRRRERDEVRAAEAAEPAAGPPDPARVLNELRALLVPLLDEAEAAPDTSVREEPRQEVAHEEPVHGRPATGAPAVPMPRPGGLAATESMLAGAELLMVACGEEEAW
jgi:hypothetical protein